jgi:hypothetical protein
MVCVDIDTMDMHTCIGRRKRAWARHIVTCVQLEALFQGYIDGEHGWAELLNEG